MDRVMAIDQYGQIEHGLDSKHPRKALLARLGAAKAQKMYWDTKDGKTYHSGYIIQGRWFTFYNVTPWQKEA